MTDAQLQLTGGSSVPGALTGGDVDLHLRVEPAAFRATVHRLRADPALLAAYNAMKREHDSPDEPAYEAAKSAFFDRLLDPDAP